MRERPRRPSRRRLWLVVPSVLLLVAWFALPVPPDGVEALYSRGVFRWWAAALAPVTSAVPVSLTLIALLASLAWLCWKTGRAISRRRRSPMPRPGIRGIAAAALRRGATIAVVLALWFVIAWGAGYRRVEIETRLGLAAADPDAALAAEVADDMLAIVRANADAEPDVARAFAAIRAVLAERVAAWDGRPIGLPTRVKELPAGTLLAFGVTGITSPWLLEPHVDAGLPPPAFLFTASHELAHCAGLCGEADADLAAYVTGLGATDRFARYATALRALRALTRYLPAERIESIRAALPARARDDLAAIGAALRRYRIGWASRIASGVYDRYLRSQGVEAGVADYDRGTDLLLRACRAGLVERPRRGGG